MFLTGNLRGQPVPRERVGGHELREGGRGFGAVDAVRAVLAPRSGNRRRDRLGEALRSSFRDAVEREHVERPLVVPPRFDLSHEAGRDLDGISVQGTAHQERQRVELVRRVDLHAGCPRLPVPDVRHAVERDHDVGSPRNGGRIHHTIVGAAAHVLTDDLGGVGGGVPREAQLDHETPAELADVGKERRGGPAAVDGVRDGLLGTLGGKELCQVGVHARARRSGGGVATGPLGVVGQPRVAVDEDFGP